jgi:methionine aminopeptidase
MGKAYKTYSYLFIMKNIRDGLSSEQICALIERYSDAGYEVVDRMDSHGVAHIYRDGPAPLACISTSAVYLKLGRSSKDIREIMEIAESV